MRTDGIWKDIFSKCKKTISGIMVFLIVCSVFRPMDLDAAVTDGPGNTIWSSGIVNISNSWSYRVDFTLNGALDAGDAFMLSASDQSGHTASGTFISQSGGETEGWVAFDLRNFSDGNLSLSGIVYTGWVSSQVAASGMTLTGIKDTIEPTVLLTSVGPFTTSGTVSVNVAASESLSGFTLDDIAITNGTASGFTSSGTQYSFSVSPTSSSGTMTVSVWTGYFTDFADNPGIASNTLVFTLSGTIAQTGTGVTGTGTTWTGTTGTGTITMVLSFSWFLSDSGVFSVSAKTSESSTGFSLDDVSVTNGTASNLQSSGSTDFAFVVTPNSSSGTMTVSVWTGTFSDLSGNLNTVASNTLVFVFSIVNGTGSTGSWTTGTGTTWTGTWTNWTGSISILLTSVWPFTTSGAVTVNAVASTAASWFTLADVNVINGTASGFTSSSSTGYAFLVMPSVSTGTMTVSVWTGTFSDLSGNLNTTTSNTLVFTITGTWTTWTGIDSGTWSTGTGSTGTWSTGTWTTWTGNISIILTSVWPFTTSGAVTVNATTSESASGFAIEDITVINGTASGFVSNSSTGYTFLVIPSASSGTMTVWVWTGTFSDISGNLNASGSNTLVFTLSGATSWTWTGTTGTWTTWTGTTGTGMTNTGATNSGTTNGTWITNTWTTDTGTTLSGSIVITLSSIWSFTTSGAVRVNATTSRSASWFTLSDITVTNGTASGFTSSGASDYTFLAIPSISSGTMTVSVWTGTFSDLSGALNASGSNMLVFTISWSMVGTGTTETWATSWTWTGTTGTGVIQSWSVLSDIKVSLSGATQAIVTFFTDRASTWSVSYGTDSWSLTVLTGAVFSTGQTIVLSWLSPDTAYYYRVSDQQSISPLLRFKTPFVLDQSAVSGVVSAVDSVYVSGVTSTGVVFLTGGSLGIASLSATWSSITLPLHGLVITASWWTWDGLIHSPEPIGNTWSLSLSGYVLIGSIYQIGNPNTELVFSGQSPSVTVNIGTSYSGQTIKVLRSSDRGLTYSELTNCTVSSSGACIFTSSMFSLFAFSSSSSLVSTASGASSSASSTASHGGGGGWIYLLMDNCPNGDTSASYYDGKCSPSWTGSVWTVGKNATGTILANTGSIATGSTRIALSEADIRFIDVTDNWARPYIFALATRGIVNNDSMYRPDNYLTRGEFLKILANSAGWNISSSSMASSLFRDVENSEYAPYVSFAVSKNMITTGNRLFRPDDPITRAESAKMLVKALGMRPETGDFLSFQDVDASSDLAAYIETAKSSGIFSGQIIDGKLCFRPDDPITRAELAKVVSNAFGFSQVAFKK